MTASEQVEVQWKGRERIWTCDTTPNKLTPTLVQPTKPPTNQQSPPHPDTHHSQEPHASVTGFCKFNRTLIVCTLVVCVFSQISALLLSFDQYILPIIINQNCVYFPVPCHVAFTFMFRSRSIHSPHFVNTYLYLASFPRILFPLFPRAYRFLHRPSCMLTTVYSCN